MVDVTCQRRCARRRHAIVVGLIIDNIVQRTERFNFSKGAVVPERRDRGYMLCHAGFRAPVARLRPTMDNDSIEVLYWSAWKERWTAADPFGRTVLLNNEALSAGVRTKGSYYRDKYNRLHARRGPVRAIMAIVHKLLIAAFHMLSMGEAFRDRGESYSTKSLASVPRPSWSSA